MSRRYLTFDLLSITQIIRLGRGLGALFQVDRSRHDSIRPLTPACLPANHHLSEGALLATLSEGMLRFGVGARVWLTDGEVDGLEIQDRFTLTRAELRHAHRATLPERFGPLGGG